MRSSSAVDSRVERPFRLEERSFYPQMAQMAQITGRRFGSMFARRRFVLDAPKALPICVICVICG